MKKSKLKQTKIGAATFNSLEHYESKKQRRVVPKTEDNGSENYKAMQFGLWIFINSQKIISTAEHWLSWLLDTLNS